MAHLTSGLHKSGGVSPEYYIVFSADQWADTVDNSNVIDVGLN